MTGLVHADMVGVTGDVASGTGQITFDDDVTFVIETTGSIGAFVFDEWTSSDGAPSGTNFGGGGLEYSINGGTSSTSSGQLVDNLASDSAAITANDGYILFIGAISVDAGDTFTLTAGSYSIPSTPGFNPLLNDYSFNGSVFLTNGSGVRISNIVSSVPEPTSLSLLGFVVLGLSTRRRKRKVAEIERSACILSR